MSEEAVAGLVLIAVPVLFNVTFTLLAQRFDYPDVLRRPSHEVLERFRAGGSSLILIWWVFALSAVLFAPLAVLLGIALDDADATVVILGVVIGVLASLVQFLGPDPLAVPGPVPGAGGGRHQPGVAARRGDRRRLSGLQPLPGRRRR